MESNIIGSSLNGIQRNQNTKVKFNKKTKDLSFNNILNKQLEKQTIKKKDDNIIFSKHANLRLEQRNISFSNNELKQISNAIDTADKRGIKNPLIIMDKSALIANVKSRTIVTVVDNIKDKVFTNVDGVVSI